MLHSLKTNPCKSHQPVHFRWGGYPSQSHVLLAALLSTLPLCFSQTPNTSSKLGSFDVSVIKQSSDNGARFSMRREAWGLSAIGVTLRDLMMTAYGVSDSEILNGPDWVRSMRFDVTAKVVNEDTALPEERLRSMLQSLLADRFQLKVHWKSKDQVPAYTLTVIKGGPKFSPSLEPARRFQKRSGLGEKHITLTKVSMPAFINILANALGRPIADETNLSGEYDITLKWLTDEALLSGPKNPSNLPQLPTALQEQLGLKLVPSKGTLRILEIQHAEKPGPN